MIRTPSQIDNVRALGEGVTIWPFASVIRGAVLGARCQVASCAIVDGARLGADCRIGHGAQVHPGAWIGERVFIGPGAVLANDAWPSVDKAGWSLTDFSEAFATIVIEDDAAIGANAVVLPGVRIGAGAMVAAGAVVTDHVAPGWLWPRAGWAARPITAKDRATRVRRVLIADDRDLLLARQPA